MIIKKPWGQEELIEHNKNYVVKKLTMHKGHRCSLQYHDFNRKKVYILTGLIYLNIAPLHHNPYNLFLYALGLDILNKELN